MKLLAMLMLLTLLTCMIIADSSHDDHYVEIFSSTADGSHVMVRNKRSPDSVCKYKKGDWSQCDTLVMVGIIIETLYFSCILTPRALDSIVCISLTPHLIAIPSVDDKKGYSEGEKFWTCL